MRKTIFETNVTFVENLFAKQGSERNLAEVLLGREWAERVESVRNEKDPEKQKLLKQQMPAFTISGVFWPSCKADDLLKHSGFICVDLDEKDNESVSNFQNLKDEIHKIPYVTYCARSIRGRGFFCVIPIADPSKHLQHFHALQRDFKACGLTIDPACSDVCRRRTVTYDPSPYVNTAAKVYDQVYEEEEHISSPQTKYTSESTREAVESLIEAIREREVDITPTYDDWFLCLRSIASEFGADGREYAHAVSCYYPDYTYDETDKKYNAILREPKPKSGNPITIATFISIARAALNNAADDFKDVVISDEDDFDEDDL